MHPFERGKTAPVPGIKPSLHVLLKEGWELAPRKRSFVTESGEQLSLKGILPEGARVVPVAPSLAKAGHHFRSDAERYLARNVQVVFPEGVDAAEYADSLRQLDPVEEVRMPPQIGLA